MRDEELTLKMDVLREKYKNKEKIQVRLVKPMPEPRYDEVYEEGIKWIESLR